MSSSYFALIAKRRAYGPCNYKCEQWRHPFQCKHSPEAFHSLPERPLLRSLDLLYLLRYPRFDYLLHSCPGLTADSQYSIYTMNLLSRSAPK